MTDTPRIRVMLVEDHAVVRTGLSAFLMTCEDIELVAEASGGEQALTVCQRANPDVILMDLVMPGMDGATATRLIREKCPHVQVIALTSFKERELVQGVLQAGAISYLLKDVTAADLARAIRAAHAGRPTLAPEAAKVLIQATRQPADELGFDLTAREREVLGLMVQGLNNAQIAGRMVVSRSTVKFHVSRILSKLRAATRTEAVALALQNHLLK